MTKTKGHIGYSKLSDLYNDLNLNVPNTNSLRFQINQKIETFKLKGGVFIKNNDISLAKVIIDNYLQDQIDEESLPNSFIKYEISKTKDINIFKVKCKTSYDSKNEELFMTKEEIIKITTKNN